MKQILPKQTKIFSPNGLVIISFIILALAFCLLIAAFTIQMRPVRVSIPATAIAVGTPINMGTTTMTVYGAAVGADQPGFKAPSGQHFIVVDFSVVNRSDAPINISPSTDTYIKTADGQVNYLSAYQLNQPFHSGQLLPGEAVRGQLSFLAPDKAHPEFYVDAIWSGGTIPFMLNL